MKPAWSPLSVALVALCTVGCTSTIEQKAEQDHQAVQVRTQIATDQLYARQRNNPVVKLDPVARFTGKTVVYQPTQMLPAHIGRVTMRVPGRHNLRTVAALIERLVDIPVTLSEDALLPQSEFTPMASTQSPGGAGAAGARAPAAGASAGGAGGGAGAARATPATALSEEAELTQGVALAVQKAGGPRGWVGDVGAGTEIELNHQGTLVGLLDHVALHMGLKWRYSEGRIHFYRIVSRTFVVKTMPGNLTQTGGVSVGTMAVNGNSEVNIWSGIEKNLALMMSRYGRFHVDQSMGTVTVHDASINVEAVDRYVDSLNRQLGRQVALHVEVLQVTLSNDHQTGIDWNWVVGLQGGGNFKLSGPPSLTKDAASVGFMSGDGGNEWMVRALERFGRVSSAYASVITTMNRQPVPLGSQSTQSYLKQIGATLTTGTNGATLYGPPSLMPGEITTGFSMSLLPIVLDSNHVLMHCAINISSLKELVTFSSGVGLAQQSVQQPNVSSFSTQQRMTVKSGETIVLSGYENESTESKQNDVMRNVLPGSRVNTRDKTTLVVLITPKLLDI